MVLCDVRIVHRLTEGFGLAKDFESGGTEGDLLGWRGLCGQTDDDSL